MDKLAGSLLSEGLADKDNDEMDGPVTESGTEGLIAVSTTSLLLSTTPLLALALVSWRTGLQLEWSIVSGIVRTLLQLSILGAILHPIFSWGVEYLWVVLAYVGFMVSLAAIITAGRTKYWYIGMFECVLTAIGTNVTLVSVFAFGAIIPPTPVWNPQYVIPIVGMLLGNCINGASLALNTVLTSLKEQSAEIELFMSFGASPLEASDRMVVESVRIGAMPMLNSMAVIGLISIPGMMTGKPSAGSLLASPYDSTNVRMALH